MIKAFLKFNKGLLRMPIGWRMWVMILALFNMVGPLVFIGHFEAKVVLVVFMAAAMLMTVLTALTGFTRLLGLGHFLWFPLLAYLFMRLEEIPASEPFGLWLRALMVVNALSLVIDVADVVRYLKGERDEVIEAL